MGEDSLTLEELEALEEDVGNGILEDDSDTDALAAAEAMTEESSGDETNSKSEESEGQNEEGKNRNIQLLMDVYVEVTVELGRTTKTIKEILQLGEGSIIELEDKPSGEPVDILVNGRLIAKGEVVVIDENFGVRISEIIDPKERLMRLL